MTKPATDSNTPAKNRLKVALLSTEMLPVPPIRGGAVQTYLANIAPILAETFDVTVIGVSDPDLESVEHRDGVTYIRVPEPHSRTYYENAIGFLASQPWDAIVVYNQPRAVIWASGAVPNASLFLSMHNHMFQDSLIPRDLALACLSSLTGVITVSRFVAEQSWQRYPEYQHLFHPINAGVDLNHFRRDENASPLPLAGFESWLEQHDPILMTASRLVAPKGIHILLEALSRVRERWPNAGLIVAGSPRFGDTESSDYEAKLHRMADNMDGAVFFTGFVAYDKISRLFSAADLFVCNSLWQEALARVHYEAMAASLPIVTTNRGGNPEVIESGLNGFIYQPAESAEACADAILSVLSQADKGRGMGEYGRTLAEQGYAWRHTAERIANVLIQSQR